VEVCYKKRHKFEITSNVYHPRINNCYIYYIDCSQPVYLAQAQENATKASVKHVGVGFVNEASKNKQ